MVLFDPYPEIEDVHSSRIEDCEPMRTVSLYFRRLHPNQFEEDQVWLEEDHSQPETGYPTLYPRSCEINQWHPEVKLSVDVFQTYSSKNSSLLCLRVFYMLTKLAACVDLQLSSMTRSGNANLGECGDANLGEAYCKPLQAFRARHLLKSASVNLP